MSHYDESSECATARQHKAVEVACCRTPRGTLVGVLPTPPSEVGRCTTISVFLKLTLKPKWMGGGGEFVITMSHYDESSEFVTYKNQLISTSLWPSIAMSFFRVVLASSKIPTVIVTPVKAALLVEVPARRLEPRPLIRMMFVKITPEDQIGSFDNDGSYLKNVMSHQ